MWNKRTFLEYNGHPWWLMRSYNHRIEYVKLEGIHKDHLLRAGQRKTKLYDSSAFHVTEYIKKWYITTAKIIYDALSGRHFFFSFVYNSPIVWLQYISWLRIWENILLMEVFQSHLKESKPRINLHSISA